ncbi:DNA polymerase III subunit gamma/tau [Flavobacterium pallidum]|nr:DNA polymerase III subunit gamma/tau [Flavobacterium pallidum]
MEIAVEAPEILDSPVVKELQSAIIPEENPIQENIQIPKTNADAPVAKVSALSLASIRAKKELEQSGKAAAKETTELPTEAFSETDMLLQWNKYAQRLSDKGHKIMEALLLINDPKLEGTTIKHELPNEGSAIDFESGKLELLGYLRGKLHNHDITIEVIVNENISSRKAFTPQDRYNRLNEINPSLELLRKTFDLDF